MFVFNLELRICQTHITRKHASSDKRLKGGDEEMIKGDDVVARRRFCGSVDVSSLG